MLEVVSTIFVKEMIVKEIINGNNMIIQDLDIS